MEEIYKPLNYQGKSIAGYEVSNFGNVKSLEREISYETTNQTGKKFLYKRIQPEKILKTRKDRGGYLYISLPVVQGKIKSVKVHRIVAENFINNPHNFMFVNHKDENKENNNVENLEWVTMAENNSYGSRKEIFKPIAKYSLDGKLIAKYPTLRQAGRSVDRGNGKTGEGNRVSIKRCCEGELSSSMGFIWKYL
ncbi:NUMOD4 domain-containing protein [Enterococcus plantarum]|uniref:NUMOD4 domain-containing protein n=1 Tax=Enterococcus plantarum TaxID=1077675 RepID=UPI0011B3E5ED|nr:NUMOD4 domain-containing protein [Enterococcus plantarum]